MTTERGSGGHRPAPSGSGRHHPAPRGSGRHRPPPRRAGACAALSAGLEHGRREHGAGESQAEHAAASVGTRASARTIKPTHADAGVQETGPSRCLIIQQCAGGLSPSPFPSPSPRSSSLPAETKKNTNRALRSNAPATKKKKNRISRYDKHLYLPHLFISKNPFSAAPFCPSTHPPPPPAYLPERRGLNSRSPLSPCSPARHAAVAAPTTPARGGGVHPCPRSCLTRPAA